MMKTIHTLWMALALTATCSFFTACSDDREPQWNPEISEGEDLPAVGDGQFVVNYTASDGSSTRALSDGPLDANKRISSLHYYVYDKKTGNLIKKRKIRGINTNTKWPIRNREDMPWELRQDLQDTLMAGLTYRILFIANIDSTLFVKADGTDHPTVVRNDEKYETAQILLPEVPFSDNNMYYLWEDSLDAKASTTVKRKDVLLRRLVTRTDVERKEITNWRMHLYDTIANTVYKAQEKTINQSMNGHLDNFCTRMTDKMKGAYKEAAEEMAALLKEGTIRAKIHAAMKEKIVNEYTTIIQEVRCFQKMNEWTLANTVNLTYKANTRVNAINFNRHPCHLNDGLTDTNETIPMNNGKFSIVSFLTNASNTNTIESASFITADPNTNFTLAGRTFQLGKVMNRRYKVTCNPVDTMIITNKVTTIYDKNLLKFDFTKILDGIPEWERLYGYHKEGEKENFIHWVNKNVFDIIGTNIYGTNFEGFWFYYTEVRQLPPKEQINETHVNIYPSWSCEMVTGTEQNPQP